MSMAFHPEPVPPGTEGDPMIPQLAQVRSKRRDAPEVWTLELEIADDTLFLYQVNSTC